MIDRRAFSAGLIAGAATSVFGSSGNARAQSAVAARNVVLVHGAYADGSCWSEVIGRLQLAGLRPTAVQNPLTSLADDVARVRHVLTRQSGPTVLAAHSYGGQVITSLGTDAPNVVGLVYIAGFGLGVAGQIDHQRDVTVGQRCDHAPLAELLHAPTRQARD